MVVVSEAGVWRSSVTVSVAGAASIQRRQDETGGAMRAGTRRLKETVDMGRGGEIVTTRAEELSRLWEWSENIREVVGALSDAIAKLAAEDLPDGGDDKETIPASPPGVRCKNDIGGYISDRE